MAAALAPYLDAWRAWAVVATVAGVSALPDNETVGNPAVVWTQALIVTLAAAA